MAAVMTVETGKEILVAMAAEMTVAMAGWPPPVERITVERLTAERLTDGQITEERLTDERG